MHSAIRATESSTKRRETADFDQLSAGDAGTPLPGSREADVDQHEVDRRLEGRPA